MPVTQGRFGYRVEGVRGVSASRLPKIAGCEVSLSFLVDSMTFVHIYVDRDILGKLHADLDRSMASLPPEAEPKKKGA
jgi:hypothetical protein